MSDTPTLDALADEHGQRGEMEARLVDDYGSDQRAAVHTAVQEEWDRFANARIHAFIPILVERSVRARLG